MNSTNKIASLQGEGVSVKIRLAALWTALMFLYIYADILSLFRSGQIEAMMAGRIGPFVVTQGSLLGFAAMMAIPAVMAFVSLVLKHKADRWANIILGLLYTLVNVGNLIGDTWAYYIFYGVIEIMVTLLIVGHAWKWRSAANQL